MPTSGGTPPKRSGQDRGRPSSPAAETLRLRHTLTASGERRPVDGVPHRSADRVVVAAEDRRELQKLGLGAVPGKVGHQLRALGATRAATDGGPKSVGRAVLRSVVLHIEYSFCGFRHVMVI